MWWHVRAGCCRVLTRNANGAGIHISLRSAKKSRFLSALGSAAHPSTYTRCDASSRASDRAGRTRVTPAKREAFLSTSAPGHHVTVHAPLPHHTRGRESPTTRRSEGSSAARLIIVAGASRLTPAEAASAEVGSAEVSAVLVTSARASSDLLERLVGLAEDARVRVVLLAFDGDALVVLAQGGAAVPEGNQEQSGAIRVVRPYLRAISSNQEQSGWCGRT